MSKIGEKPVPILPNTQVIIEKDKVIIKGKEGEMKIDIPKSIKLFQEKETILVERERNDKKTKALHGLIRSLINNAILGVNNLWQKRLKVVGTGYRAKMQGENLVLEVGFSHPVIFKKVEGVSLSVEEGGTIVIKGVNKQLVGQVAYQIKSIKKPDPYKGKGIRYEGEKIKLKPGKKAKAAGGAEK